MIKFYCQQLLLATQAIDLLYSPRIQYHLKYQNINTFPFIKGQHEKQVRFTKLGTLCILLA